MAMLIWTIYPWVSSSISFSNTMGIPILVLNNLRRGCTFSELPFESWNVVGDRQGDDFVTNKAVIICEFHWGVTVEKFVADEKSNVGIAQEWLSKNRVGFPMRELILSEVVSAWFSWDVSVVVGLGFFYWQYKGTELPFSLLWPGYFAAMQNELCKTTNFVQYFPIC